VKAEALYALPRGTVVAYGQGITARKDADGWVVFEDDRPGLRVSSLVPDRVTHVIEEGDDPPPAGLVERMQDQVRADLAANARRTDELRARLADRATAGIKPPIGVIPRVIWEDRRLAELDRAMVEYHAFGLPADPAWEVEHDDLLAQRALRGPATVAALVRGRQAGKYAEQIERAAAVVDELVRRARGRRCGVLLVNDFGSNSLLAYVDERIPDGEILQHPAVTLPEGGVEALLASLYPPAGPAAAGHVAGCFLRGPIRHCVEGCTWVDDGRERMEGATP